MNKTLLIFLFFIFLSINNVNGQNLIIWNCFVSGEGVTSSNIPINCSVYGAQEVGAQEVIAQAPLWQIVTDAPPYGSSCAQELFLCREYSNGISVTGDKRSTLIFSGDDSNGIGSYDPDYFGLYIVGGYSTIPTQIQPFANKIVSIDSVEQFIDLYAAAAADKGTAPNYNVITELEKSIAVFASTQSEGDNTTIHKPICDGEWFCSTSQTASDIDAYCSTHGDNQDCAGR
ncbi:MAG: hypothetical protein ACJASR_001935 [Psychroserpens sp.]|jgi:hypothetical protein